VGGYTPPDNDMCFKKYQKKARPVGLARMEER